jgi:hypothetical protein
MSEIKSIFGCAGYIVHSSLATVYTMIRRLPAECQVVSVRHDVVLLLRAKLGKNCQIKVHRPHNVLFAGQWCRGKAPPAKEILDAL